ncbi:Pla2g12a [Symbiodinium natans]|uniref:Pla2g12a protein n=1 Tax=Symbiodinium natans TaxID=878477 RepID=A0A812Q380_9DINO|nr:Pla2g12a [Symbiodinium natans]
MQVANSRRDLLFLGRFCPVGLNSAGLGVCVFNLHDRQTDGFEKPAVSVQTLVWELLLCGHSLRSALAWIQQLKLPPMCGSALLLVDASGAATVELNPGGPVIGDVKLKDPIMRANHPILSQSTATFAAGKKARRDSERRMQAVEAEIERRKGADEQEQFDGSAAISVLRKAKKVRNLATLAVIGLDLLQGRLLVEFRERQSISNVEAARFAVELGLTPKIVDRALTQGGLQMDCPSVCQFWDLHTNIAPWNVLRCIGPAASCNILRIAASMSCSSATPSVKSSSSLGIGIQRGMKMQKCTKHRLAKHLGGWCNHALRGSHHPPSVRGHQVYDLVDSSPKGRMPCAPMFLDDRRVGITFAGLAVLTAIGWSAFSYPSRPVHVKQRPGLLDGILSLVLPPEDEQYMVMKRKRLMGRALGSGYMLAGFSAPIATHSTTSEPCEPLPQCAGTSSSFATILSRGAPNDQLYGRGGCAVATLSYALLLAARSPYKQSRSEAFGVSKCVLWASVCRLEVLRPVGGKKEGEAANPLNPVRVGLVAFLALFLACQVHMFKLSRSFYVCYYEYCADIIFSVQMPRTHREGKRDDLIQQVLDRVKRFRRAVAPKRPSDGQPVPEAEGMDNAILVEAQRRVIVLNRFRMMEQTAKEQGVESGQLSEACRLLTWAMADASFSAEKLSLSIEEFKTCGGTAVRASAPAQMLLKRAIFQMKLWNWRDRLREERKELKRATEQMVQMEMMDQEHTKRFPGRPMRKEEVEKIVQARNLLGRKVRQGQSFRQQLHFEMAEAEAVLRRSLRSAAGQRQLSLQEQNARFHPERTLTVGKEKGWWRRCVVYCSVVQRSISMLKVCLFTDGDEAQAPANGALFFHLPSRCSLPDEGAQLRDKRLHCWNLFGHEAFLGFAFPLKKVERCLQHAELRGQDGTATAHSAVLRAVSQPFRQMLNTEMSEGQYLSLQDPNVAKGQWDPMGQCRDILHVYALVSRAVTTRADLLFFLRLLYTGQVDEADWDGLSGTPHFQAPLRQWDMRLMRPSTCGKAI